MRAGSRVRGTLGNVQDAAEGVAGLAAGARGRSLSANRALGSARHRPLPLLRHHEQTINCSAELLIGRCGQPATLTWLWKTAHAPLNGLTICGDAVTGLDQTRMSCLLNAEAEPGCQAQLAGPRQSLRQSGVQAGNRAAQAVAAKLT